MDIAYLTEWAKEFLLADSTHGPTLFVQTDKQIIIAGVPNLPPTPGERVLAFRAMGRKFGLERRSETLKEVAFIVLTWASLQRPGDPAPKVRPSQDPNRKEMMMISLLRLADDGSYQHQAEVVEIMRERGGKVLDLLHLPEAQAAIAGNEDPSLLAFIKGYKSGQGNPDPLPQRFDPQTGQGHHGKPPRRK